LNLPGVPVVELWPDGGYVGTAPQMVPDLRCRNHL